MPQKRQAPRPDAVRKPEEHARAESYPGAPKDPKERQEYFRRRNARISGVDEDVYLESLVALDGRTLTHLDEQRPKK